MNNQESILSAAVDPPGGGIEQDPAIPFKPRCFAYKEDGSICGERGMAFDAQRGFFVCAEHRSEKVFPNGRWGRKGKQEKTEGTEK